MKQSQGFQKNRQVNVICSEMNWEHLEKESFSKYRRGLVPSLRSLKAVPNFTTEWRPQGLGRVPWKEGNQPTASAKGPPDAPSGRAWEEKPALSQTRAGHRTAALLQQVCFSISILRRCHKSYNCPLKSPQGVAVWPFGSSSFPFYHMRQMMSTICLFSVRATLLSEGRAKHDLLQREYTFFPFLKCVQGRHHAAKHGSHIRGKFVTAVGTCRSHRLSITLWQETTNI